MCLHIYHSPTLTHIATYKHIYISIYLSVCLSPHKHIAGSPAGDKKKQERKERKKQETKRNEKKRKRKRKKKKFCLDPVPAFLSGNCFPKEGISCPPIPRLRTKPVNSSQEKTETLGLGNIFKSAKMISLFC